MVRRGELMYLLSTCAWSPVLAFVTTILEPIVENSLRSMPKGCVAFGLVLKKHGQSRERRRCSCVLEIHVSVSVASCASYAVLLTADLSATIFTTGDQYVTLTTGMANNFLPLPPNWSRDSTLSQAQIDAVRKFDFGFPQTSAPLVAVFAICRVVNYLDNGSQAPVMQTALSNPGSHLRPPPVTSMSIR